MSEDDPQCQCEDFETRDGDVCASCGKPIFAPTIRKLETESGEVMLHAWGVHDSALFATAAFQRYGYRVPSDQVRHLCMLELRRHPDGRFGRWYEPVRGEPNATIWSA